MIIILFFSPKNNDYFYNMKTKQPKSNRLSEAEKEALFLEIEANQPAGSLFPEKLAEAKALLARTIFPPDFPSIKREY
jgi:hypothetical protein